MNNPQPGETNPWEPVETPPSGISSVSAEHPSSVYAALFGDGIPSPPPPPENDLTLGPQHYHHTNSPTLPVRSSMIGAGIGVGCGTFIILLLFSTLLILFFLHTTIPGLLSKPVFSGGAPQTVGPMSRSLPTKTPGSSGTFSGGSPPPANGTMVSATGISIPAVSPTSDTHGTMSPEPTTTTVTATATSLPQLPLRVTGTSTKGHSLTFTIATNRGALLHISVNLCGQNDSTYNNFITQVADGTFSDTIMVKGCAAPSINVVAHLEGYADASASTTVLVE